MAKSPQRRTFSREFKIEAVRAIADGKKTAPQLARQLGAKRTLFLLALTAVLSLISAVSAEAQNVPASSWPMYQFSRDHNAVFSSAERNTAWKTQLGGKVNGGLALVGNVIYAESFDHRVYAIDATNGRIVWSRLTSGVMMNTPVVSQGVVITGTGTDATLVDNDQNFVMGRPSDDDIYALNAASGSILWKYTTTGENMPTGTFAIVGTHPAFVFANGDEHLRALDLSTGRLLWKQQILGISAMSSLASYGDQVIGGSSASFSFFSAAYRAQNRVRLAHRTWTWSARLRDGQLRWVSPFGVGDCSPTIGDDTVLVATAQAEPLTTREMQAGTLVSPHIYDEIDALDLNTGKLLWRYQGGVGTFSRVGSSELAIAALYANHTFYESLPSAHQFAAFDSHNGHVKWVVDTDGPVKMSAVLKDGLLYFGDTAGYFYVIRASDGTIQSKLHFPDFFTTAPPVIAGSTLFVTNDKMLYALRLGDLKSGTLRVDAAASPVSSPHLRRAST